MNYLDMLNNSLSVFQFVLYAGVAVPQVMQYLREFVPCRVVNHCLVVQVLDRTKG